MSDVLTLADRPKVERTRSRLAPARIPSWTGWVLPIVLLAVWQIGVSTGFIATTVLPAPIDIVRAGYAATQSGDLQHNMGAAVSGSPSALRTASRAGRTPSPIRRCRWCATSRIWR